MTGNPLGVLSRWPRCGAGSSGLHIPAVKSQNQEEISWSKTEHLQEVVTDSPANLSIQKLHGMIFLEFSIFFSKLFFF